MIDFFRGHRQAPSTVHSIKIIDIFLGFVVAQSPEGVLALEMVDLEEVPARRELIFYKLRKAVERNTV